MTQIFFAVLLVLCCLALPSRMSGQIPLEVPDVEYANDLKELRTLRRVFVYSTPDQLSRQTIVKEISRERGLLDIVERPEDADFYLVFYALGSEGADPFAGAMGLGPMTTAGTLVAFRQVVTCDGIRPRLLFITRKSRVVHSGIALPLTSLNQGGLGAVNQGPFIPSSLSKKGLGVEVVVRLGLFLLGKALPSALSFDQLNNSLAISSSGKTEVQVSREFVQQVKKARKEQPLSYPGLASSDWFGISAAGAAPPSIPLLQQSSPVLPCRPKSTRGAGANYGGAYSADGSPGYDTLSAPRPPTRLRRVGRADSSASPP